MNTDDIETQVRFVTQTLGLVRQLLGWTLAESAKAVGKKVPSQISDFEAARRTPSLKQCLTYARAYGVNLDDILKQYNQPSMGSSDLKRWLTSLGFMGIKVDAIPLVGDDVRRRLTVACRLASIYSHLDATRVLDDWR